MGSRGLRRRLRHGDVGGKSYEHFYSSSIDSLNEPLLGTYNCNETQSERSMIAISWDEKQRRQYLHWRVLFSQLIAQWAQWLANIVLGSGSFMGRLLPHTSNSSTGSHKVPPPSLSPLQEERLRNLKQRIKVPFDGSLVEHQDALKQLWRLAFPDRELPSLKSVVWKEMGWQGSDPSTDFRRLTFCKGGGFISLENLIFFAQMYPESFKRLMHKQDGTRAEWEYPFAVAGINISFLLAQMLDLQSGKPISSAGIRFLKLLEDDEMAFDNVYCVAFQVMDSQWLAKRASYMEFNEVLKSTKDLLELELALEDVFSVRDLPAYTLLKR